MLLRGDIIGPKSQSSENQAGFYPVFIWLKNCVPNLSTTLGKC